MYTLYIHILIVILFIIILLLLSFVNICVINILHLFLLYCLYNASVVAQIYISLQILSCVYKLCVRDQNWMNMRSFLEVLNKHVIKWLDWFMRRLKSSKMSSQYFTVFKNILLLKICARTHGTSCWHCVCLFWSVTVTEKQETVFFRESLVMSSWCSCRMRYRYSKTDCGRSFRYVSLNRSDSITTSRRINLFKHRSTQHKTQEEHVRFSQKITERWWFIQ